MFNQFKQWYERRHDYARDWKKKTGGKVIGYFCTYLPEEILYAGGVLPIRILGGHHPQSVGISEPYIFGMYCPFCRDCLAQGLQGKYEYLDGIMIAQSCIHIRQAFSTWRQRIPHNFDHYISMPVNIGLPQASIPFLRKELEIFKGALEEWIGRKISEEDLRNGVEIVNKNRQAMRKVYELRKNQNPNLTGLEALYMVVSSQLTDKKEHTDVVQDLFAKGLSKRELGRGSSIRLMTIGSENDDVQFLEMVESLGATIVIEDHCTGSRYFWNEVEPNYKDPLTAIAERYIKRIPCPQRDWSPERKRFGQLLRFIDDFKVQGVILIQQKFCDPHELDIPALRDLLNKRGIKNYFLEFDITIPLGQFKIRMEAFLETFKSEELFPEGLF